MGGRRAIGRFLAILLLAGCTRVGGGTSDRTTVRFDIAADPANLNPLFARFDANSVDQQLAHLVFEPFIDVDENGKAIPALLQEIPTIANGGVSADGLTIRYRLRHNVRWQDGVEVTARDVLFTLHAIFDPRNPVRSKAGYDRIAFVNAPDKYTVVVRLREPWAPAVASFFTYGTAPQYVLPAHLLAGERSLREARFNAAPVGDGPYRLVSWKRGEGLVYEANRSYWRGAPKTRRLDVHVVPDPGTNLTLLQSGAIDWNLIAPAQQAALANRPDLRFRYVPLALVAGIALNTRRAPLADVRVRRALAASVDRERISSAITFGRYPVVDTAQPLFSWARDPSVKEPRFDPAAADRLFDRAGWRRGPDGLRRKDGKPFALTYVQFPESTTGVRVATFVQSELRARGIAVTVKSVSNAQLFLPADRGGLLARGDFDLAYVPWPMGADPDDSFLLTCAGTENYMRYCDSDVDRWESAALAATSQAQRKALYAQIEARVARDVPVVYLFNPKYVYAYRDALDGFAPNAFTPTWNAERWQLR
jgi:peptide/nickel transport system substrate-binding protein